MSDFSATLFMLIHDLSVSLVKCLAFVAIIWLSMYNRPRIRVPQYVGFDTSIERVSSHRYTSQEHGQRCGGWDRCQRGVLPRGQCIEADCSMGSKHVVIFRNAKVAAIGNSMNSAPDTHSYNSLGHCHQSALGSDVHGLLVVCHNCSIQRQLNTYVFFIPSWRTCANLDFRQQIQLYGSMWFLRQLLL